MKLFILIVLILVLSTGEALAQQSSDSNHIRNKQQREQKMLLDENGDGVRDKKRTRAMDLFIDTNGDGICDHREQGLGFRRGTKQLGIQQGKKHQGGKK